MKAPQGFAWLPLVAILGLLILGGAAYHWYKLDATFSTPIRSTDTVSGADSTSAQHINAVFGVDATHAYFYGGTGAPQIIAGADPATFVSTGDHSAKDARHTYSTDAKGYLVIDAGTPQAAGGWQAVQASVDKASLAQTIQAYPSSPCPSGECEMGGPFGTAVFKGTAPTSKAVTVLFVREGFGASMSYSDLVKWAQSVGSDVYVGTATVANITNNWSVSFKGINTGAYIVKVYDSTSQSLLVTSKAQITVSQ